MVHDEDSMLRIWEANFRQAVAEDEAERELKRAKIKRQPTQKEFWDAAKQMPDFEEHMAKVNVILSKIRPVKLAAD